MKQNIVFMGTPSFAVPCLDRLIADGHTISAVFSQPDRPRGRGQRLSPTPVKKLAEEHNLPVHQPTNLKDGTVLALLKELNPDVLVVVAYGRILPKEILEVAPLGAINIHASLLPAYRGAAPIQWSIINGDKETGVTSMYMAEGMDTGDIILQEKTAIQEQETSGELFERLSTLGAEVLSKTVKKLVDGTATRTPQDPKQVTLAPMITKEMGALDFTKEPLELVNLIRGLNPNPKAFTGFEGERLVVLEATVAQGFSGNPGEVLEPKDLVVGCGSGAIQLVTVQPQGRRAMSGMDFANGRRLEGGEILTIE